MSLPIKPLVTQRRALAQALLLFVFPALLVLVAALVLAARIDVAPDLLTRDPITVSGGPVWGGAVSQVGLFFWSAAAAVAAFSAWALYRLKAERTWVHFLASLAAFSALLLLDDAFLFHDQLLPEFLGIPDIATYGFFGALLLGILFASRTVIVQTDYSVALLSLSLMAFSVGTDVLDDLQVFGESGGERLVFLEDSAKFLGIAAWLGYIALSSRLAILKTFPKAERPSRLTTPPQTPAELPLSR